MVMPELFRCQVRLMPRCKIPLREWSRLFDLAIPFLLQLFFSDLTLPRRGTQVMTSSWKAQKKSVNVIWRIIPFRVTMLVRLACFKGAGESICLTIAQPDLTPLSYSNRLVRRLIAGI